MSLIRFEDSDQRGPSVKIWLGLVDWVKGSLAIDGGVSDVDDFTPYNAGNLTISTDTGGAVAVRAVPLGVVQATATQAADAVSGFQRNEYIDLTATKRVAFEARVEAVADTASTIMFVGFTDEVLDGAFGTDNTLDGSALGLQWNADETVDLISVSSGDVTTILIAEVATGVLRTDGMHKFGIRVEQLSSTTYRVTGAVNGVAKSISTTTVPGEPMLPVVCMTEDNTAAPTFYCDWTAFVDTTPDA